MKPHLPFKGSITTSLFVLLSNQIEQVARKRW